ncbi:retrovirus-related pol polyprotein from transposon TNT 1-94 [Tanacetum coccineum]
MCMFALTVSIVEPKNIKEAMADSAWIEAMQDELHQFDRLKVWELVDKPFGKMVIKLKWLWKNKKDEDQTVIRNKARLVAKGYAQEEGIDFEESFAPTAAEYVALSASWSSSNVDEDTTSTIMASQYNKIPFVLRTLSPAIAISCKPRTTLTDKAHPYLGITSKEQVKMFGYEALLRPTPLPEYPTRDFTMSTSSLQAEKTIYTSLTLFSNNKLNVES